jgi:hypothetical protein
MVESQARGILPDAITDREIVLLKATSYLRLTYEIRLATFMAQSKRLDLSLSVPFARGFLRSLPHSSPHTASLLGDHPEHEPIYRHFSRRH